MTRHTPELNNCVPQAPAMAGANTPEGRAFVQEWIARNQKRLAAGLGATVLALPLLAEAQAVGPLVNVADIAGVRSVALGADGSAQLVLANGQQVQVAASAVQVGANGAVLVTQAAAQMVAEVVASVAAAGGGVVAGAAGGLGGGAAAAGIGLGVAAAGAAAGGGGGSSPAPEQLLRLNIESFAAPQSLSQIFGSVAADVLPTDSVTVTLGADSAAQTLHVSYNTSESAWQIDGITGTELAALLQGRQPLSFTATRTPEEGPATEITGSVNAFIDTIAPEIAITEVAGGDNVLNAAEQADALVVSGTTDAENGQVVTVQVLEEGEVIATGTATVTDGTWSARIATTTLQDAASYSLRATVSDAAGNPAASPASGSVTTDFSAAISIVTVPELTTAATFFDLVISGTTTDVGAGRAVSVSFAGVTYPAGTTDSAGAWSVTIPQSVLAELRDADTSPIPLSAPVTDAAGNTATAIAPQTPTYSAPSLTITTPAADLVLNGTTAAQDLEISGQTVPGASVVVQIGSVTLDAVHAGTDGAWTATATTLPADGSYTITASATLNNITVATPATVGLVIDTAAPVVTITDAGVGTDGVLNAAEREAGFTISGTVADAGTADLTTLQLTVELVVGSNAPIPLQATIAANGNWTAPVPAGVDLPDDATIQIRASATDAAGNSDAPRTADFTTDYTASIEVSDFTITTINRFTGLTVTGTSAGVEAGQTVTLRLGDAESTGPVAADGTWSVLVPKEVIAELQTGTNVSVSASLSDVAGNPASATATITPNFSQPPLTITSPADGAFINAATAAGDLVISGLAIPGQEVTLVTPAVSGGLSDTADSTTGEWSITIPNGALPSTDGPVGLQVSITIDGVSEQASLTLTRDATPPALTLETEVTEAGLVVSGTASPDVSEVTLDVLGTEYTLQVTDERWSITIPGEELPKTVPAVAQVTVTANDSAGNPATPQSDDIPVILSVDNIGTDGALILTETGDVAFSGRAFGVQADQVVTISAGGQQVGTATVAADGTWTTNIARPSIAAGETVSYSFAVSNASGAKTADTTGDLVGYLPSVFSAVFTGFDTNLNFFIATELDNATGRTIQSFSFTMDYDPSVVTLIPAARTEIDSGNPDQPETAATGGLHPTIALGERTPNEDANGSVQVFGIRLIGRINASDLEAAPIYVFDMGYNAPNEQIIITLRNVQANGISVGSTVSYTGTNADDTIIAANVDTVIRGGGGNDIINVSAPGVNTIIFEADPDANGEDEITGFTVGGALADRIAFFFSDSFPESALRGDLFQLLAGGAQIEAGVGFVVFTTEVSEEDSLAVLNALALGANQTIFALGADDEGGGLLWVQADGAGQVVEAGVRMLAEFTDLSAADLAQFSSANILGFEQFV
ncbi:MAG: hypothetical protein LAT78_06090 [Roseinatronobacter sp.]|nr:hypothetical protein [Roseinatronobacter sp.]